jgi:hypothetical protein
MLPQSMIPNRPQTITLALATLAETLIRVALPSERSLHRALVRAQPRLFSQAWAYDRQSGVVAINSYSRPHVVHHASPDSCDCEAATGVCWHRASAHILQTIAAAGVAPLAPLPLTDPDALAAAADDADQAEYLGAAVDETTIWTDQGDDPGCEFVEEPEPVVAPASAAPLCPNTRCKATAMYSSLSQPGLLPVWVCPNAWCQREVPQW